MSTIHRSLIAVALLGLALPGAASADTTGPDLRLTGGSLLDNRWLGGDHPVNVEARDPSGVRQVVLVIDEKTISSWTNDCSASASCVDIVQPFWASARNHADGIYQAYVRAVDRYGNSTASARWNVRFESTPPDRPIDFALKGSGSWRSTNSFQFDWRNPVQGSFAAIAGARYELCPIEVTFGSTRCTKGEHLDFSNEIRNLTVPNQGQWMLRAWLVDQASNANPSFVTEPISFGLDEDPPTLSIERPSSDDPTAIPLAVADGMSGLETAEVEVRRERTSEWRPLRVERSRDKVLARLDDEALVDGVYDIRSRVRDAAGNERSSASFIDGSTARLTLPVRLKTRLAAGRKVKRSGKSRGPSLTNRPLIRGGSRTVLSGRLTSEAGNSLPSAVIEVSERVDLPGEVDHPIGRVISSRTGRFSFKVPSGPRRRLTFRYPGTATIRPASSAVELRVKAQSTLRVSRSSVVNGEDVVFRGRLLGRPLPSPSKLLKLQVLSRRRWLTFATPSANTRNGLWSYRYRFAATRGHVRYRFRVVIPREGSYPFDTGSSRQVFVRVRGL